MKKKLLSLLLCFAMIIAMIPLADITAEAAMSEAHYWYKAEYSYSSDSDPSSVSITNFAPNAGGWDAGGTSPKTRDFIAHFDVLSVVIDIPAYTKMSMDFMPRVGVNTLTEECSSYFGVELFRFENEGDWNNITFNTDENTTRSNGYSIGRNIARKVAIVAGDNDAEINTSFERTFDNPTGETKREIFYFGILAFYRSTSVFEHQLDTWWNFSEAYNSTHKYLEYDANGGSGSAAMVEAAAGEDVTLHSGEGFSKPNSVFLGWSDGQTVYAPGSVYTKAEGACLKAQYLTYDTSGCSGTVTPGTRGENGVVIADGSSLYKVGHTFKHWTESPHGYGTPYVLGDVYSGNNEIILYPIFEPNKYDLDLVTENCTASVNQNPATYGTRVDITDIPSAGYKVTGFDIFRTDDPTVKVNLTGARSFIQPEYPVTVKPVLEKIPYAIETLPSENGSFTVSGETACIDDTVTVTATPDEGFELDAITVNRVDTGELLPVTDCSFTMVPAPVRVAVSFKNRLYDITKAATENGSFTVYPESAILGETVVVNVEPDEGYQLKSITAYKTGDETVTLEVTDGSFTMPAFPVTVAVEFEPAPLAIFKSTQIEHGDITISHTEATMSQTVSVTAQPAQGYTLDAITVYKTGDPSVTVTVTDGSFEMPRYPVTVHADFKKIDYTITLVDAANEKGSFTVDKTVAQIGDAVTVDITCAEGWAVRGIRMTDSSGKSTFVNKVFIMPADNVTVSVSYMVIPTYVITIPATVELGGAPMTVAITDAVMDPGVNLKIDLQTDLIARTAEGAQKPFVINTNGGTVQSGDVILTVEGGGTPQNPKSGSVQLSFEWDETYQYSGEYYAVISFTIRVEDEGYDQSEGGGAI